MREPLEELEAGLAEGTGDELVRSILESPPQLLERLFDNPRLDENHLLLALRRPDVPGELLRKVAQTPPWNAAYQVKVALVSHPHTPRTVAQNYVKHLFWRDLMKVISNLLVSPTVRRLAEVSLRDRMHEITLGERIALARAAPHEVIKVLRHQPEPRVMRALLDNPRLTEDDLLAVASSRKTPASVLDLLARSERWMSRHNVKLALVRNPQTPVARTMVLLTGLAGHELCSLARRAEAPQAVRGAARGLLARRARRGDPV